MEFRRKSLVPATPAQSAPGPRPQRPRVGRSENSTDTQWSSLLLTERIARTHKPGPKTRILWDHKLKGLGCRITRAGSRAYVLRYTDTKGKQRLATLARVGEVPLKTIRQLAGEELLKVRMGEDGPLRRRRERRDAATVAEGIARFFDEFCPVRVRNRRMAPNTVEQYRQQAARYLLPAIGTLDIAAVQRTDIETMVAPLPPVLRNRVLALASRVFRYFEDQELRQQYSNPCRAVERSREEARDRTLSTAEIAALSGAMARLNIHPVKRAVIHVAILTGLRISEVLSMRWDCVNFESANVLLPSTKTGRRTHPLSSAALDTLKQLPTTAGPIFCIGPSTPVTYWMVRLAFVKAAEAAGLKDVRLHDLRRTFMTRAAEAGVSSHTLRDLLGHKTAMMADRYVRRTNVSVATATEQISGELAKVLKTG